MRIPRLAAFVTLASLAVALPGTASGLSIPYRAVQDRVGSWEHALSTGPSDFGPTVALRSTAVPPVQLGTFHVAATTVDLSAPAPPGQGTSVTLATEIWFPGTSQAGKPVPDRTGAPYPLVVFSQGFDFPVSGYAVLLRQWASAGFVVAAPTYPYTSPPGPVYEADIVNHPAELRSVIGALTATAGRNHWALSGLINAGRVAVAGQSDGGDVTLATADNTCCRDPAVKAATVLSGAELSSFGGAYFAGPPVPLLVVQGSADPINAPSCSAQIYDAAKKPKWYLDLSGVGHLAPYSSVTPPEPVGPSQNGAVYRRVVAEVTTDFFEAELSPKPAVNRPAARSLVALGDVPGFSALTAGAQAPVPAGYCPGAPK